MRAYAAVNAGSMDFGHIVARVQRDMQAGYCFDLRRIAYEIAVFEYGTAPVLEEGRE